MGKMSSFAHFITDLCFAKLLIYHGTLSNNGEAMLLFFKCMLGALGGPRRGLHSIFLVIILEKCALGQDTFCHILPMRSLQV